MPQHIHANHAPKDIKFPVEEKKSSDSDQKSGITFFHDVYIVAQLIQSVALLHMNPCSFLLGAITGAAKPYKDYLRYHQVPKGTTFEANQRDVGEGFLASVSDPDLSKKATPLTAMAFPVLFIYGLEKAEAFSFLTLPLTFVMGLRLGHEMSERYIQLIAPVYPKKQ